jgi:hypothetical protein
MDTATEERCFLFGPCLDVICRVISEFSAVQLSEVKGSEELVDELENLGSVLVSCSLEKLVSEARGRFGYPEEVERSPLEAVTRRQQVKIRQTEKT